MSVDQRDKGETTDQSVIGYMLPFDYLLYTNRIDENQQTPKISSVSTAKSV